MRALTEQVWTRVAFFSMGSARARQEKTKKGHSFPLLGDEICNPATLGPGGSPLAIYLPRQKTKRKKATCVQARSI